MFFLAQMFVQTKMVYRNTTIVAVGPCAINTILLFLNELFSDKLINLLVKYIGKQDHVAVYHFSIVADQNFIDMV
jgi:hypothetical protein